MKNSGKGVSSTTRS